MTLTAIEHGTLSGYKKEYRRGLPICPDCRAAMTAYAREYRSGEIPGRRDKESKLARSRAITRLTRLHPAEFTQLYGDELVAIRRLADRPGERP